MGEHKNAPRATDTGNSFGRKPNPIRLFPTEVPILCVVCHTPTAIWADEKGRRYRLAKSVTRVTAKHVTDNPIYVHDDPCKAVLIQNWAQFVVDNKGLAGMVKANE